MREPAPYHPGLDYPEPAEDPASVILNRLSGVEDDVSALRECLSDARALIGLSVALNVVLAARVFGVL